MASCVVFDAEGPVRGQYRRYNIAGIEPGDDYAAMHQALERRFRRAVEEGGVLPDVLLIDGGAGQLAQARAVLARAGRRTAWCWSAWPRARSAAPAHETLLLPDGRELQPGRGLAGAAADPAGARRGAPLRHHRPSRQARRRRASTSRLEDIPGIGPRRRASLLKHFGGLAGLKAAGVEEIARVEGINAALAERIYATLHGLDAIGSATADATEPR